MQKTLPTVPLIRSSVSTLGFTSVFSPRRFPLYLYSKKKDMGNKTAVEYLQEHFKTLIEEDKKGIYRLLFEQAKEMESEKIYETKAFWFGRGIHAGRENKIKELQPKR